MSEPGACCGTGSLFVQADVVNAAGLTTRGTLLDTTPELFDAHVAVNLKAPFFLMQAVVADLVARQAPGTIVNISCLGVA
jgi:NAD(P)-dependent dehydrogenase (short-subunit alcohol dehydrogenase family)